MRELLLPFRAAGPIHSSSQVARVRRALATESNVPVELLNAASVIGRELNAAHPLRSALATLEGLTAAGERHLPEGSANPFGSTTACSCCTASINRIDICRSGLCIADVDTLELAMRVQIKRWGNSASVRIPAPIMAAPALRIDQEVEVREDAGRIVIEPVTAPSYDLDALLAGMTPETFPEEIDFGPVGKEIW